MKKRVLSFLLAVCMVLSIAPMPAYAEAVPTYYCGEEHTHTDTCLVDPNGAAPASEEEPQEEPPTCTCETACAAGAMNTACAVCGAGGAGVEGCGKYVAPAPDEEPQEEPPTCTCETACAAGAMNTACAVCGAGGAGVESCGKYVAPAVCTCETACTAENMSAECAVCGGADAKLENCTKYQAPVSYTVTFNVGEHGVAPESQTVTSGGIITKPADPTAEGFTFGGWYVDEAYTTEYDFSAAVTANTTLHAKWTEAVPAHTHFWATDWSMNTTHHWHECTATDCDLTENSDKDGYGEHTMVGGLCSVCNKQAGFSVTVGDSVSYFDDMYEAFGATTTGTEQSPATVKLLTNVTYTTWRFGVVSTGAYVVLDLNGYTLTFSHENAGIDVVEGSHFTLMDSSDGETGSIVADYTEQFPTGSRLIRVSEQSTMILESGRLVPAIYAAEAIVVRETSTLIQNGGVIEGTAFNAVSVYTGSLFTQNGGTIISNGFAVWIEDDGSRYVLEGGTLFLNGNWASGDGGYFDLNEGGAVTINGGVFDAVGLSGASVPTRYLIARGSYGDYEIIINAATFKKADNATLCTTNGCYDGTITIKFKNVVFENGVALYPGATETLGEYLAPGYLYYDENGNVITLTEGMTELTGKVTVAECTNHTGGTATCTTLAVCELCKLEYGTYYHADDDGDLFCNVCGGLPITEATFPDANFRAYIAENFDTDKDNALSPDEIAAVTILNVKGLGINDITGLAYFTELVELYAGGNAFGAIDLSTLKKLRVLNLESCAYLRQLDVSALGDLEELYMRDCHYVTSLNLERNGYLTYLDIERSGIKSLDVSKNVSLLSLNIQDTGITSLDLSNNPGAGLLMGENTTYRDFQHCGVGYLNMSQFGDTSRMTVMEGGTLGADGWIKLDAGATKIVYEYDLQNDPQNAARLFVEIIIDNRGIDHNYAANAISKDETGHYAQFCTTCRTGNEETFAPHTLDENGVCTANCGFACTHGYDHTDSGMCSLCGKQRLFLVTVGGTGHYFDSLEDALAKAAEGTADAPAAVKLLTDLTHTGQSVEIAKGAHVTLDLNGFTLDMGSEAIWNYGSLELRDSRGGGQLTGSGRFTVDSNGSFTLTSGTVSNINSEWDTSAVRLGNYGEMIMNGGTVQGAANGIYAIVDSRITINAGTVIGTGYSGICSNAGELLVNGGEIRGYGYGIESIHSNVHITGGIVDGYLLNANGTLLLSGGTVTEGISTDGTLADCLAPGLFFHDANGDPIALEPDQDYIAVLVTVAECAHIDRVGDHICDVCGETVSQCADENNDHKCDVCGTVLSQCTGGTATCVAQAVCTICGQPYGELDPDNHSGAADKLASNGDGTHNASYSCCGVAAQENVPCTPADCTKESLCACGYSMAATQTEHNFSGAYAYDENGHWRKCLYCEVVGPWEEHFGQSTGQGCEAAILCDCGYVMVPAKGHSSNTLFFGIDDHYHYEGCSTCTLPVNDKTYPHNFTETNYNDDEHWYICADCQWEGEKQVHTYGEDRTCVCGAEKPREAVELTITWTATEFTYVDGEWNPDTHEYNEGEWIGECTVTLENTGVEDVAYSVTYTSTVDGITGVFCTTENPKADSVTGTLAADEKKVITFKPDGKPSKALDNEKIGTLTIKLGGD